MAEQEASQNITLGKAKTSDAVYAVNKAGDFSKGSVREKNWPSDADEKQDIQELNKQNSNGAKRFEDAIARVIQLGDVPRGISSVNPRSGNDERDSAMGVITLPHSDLQARFEGRMKDLGDIIIQAHKPASSPYANTKVEIIDKNEPKELSSKPKGGVEAVKSHKIETADHFVSSTIQNGKKLIEVKSFKSHDLWVL